ncbi:MAG TPA: hypothetical protein VGW10_03860 [Solirubrobacteraceae bacterium]|nr:hypothetical protein [Solirubrobacteraceae bacterium]
MRFVDFLKTTVLISAASATLLGTIAVLSAANAQEDGPLFFAAGWWLAAGVIGAYLGRRAETTPPIARLLAGARSATTLPEQRPGAMLLNRLWPLFLVTLAASGLAVVAPQIPAIAAGFAVIWALSWRRQESAVSAIEERDGVQFFVERTSPLKPIQLVRVPGFRKIAPPSFNGA